MLCPSAFIATVVIQRSPHDSHVLTGIGYFTSAVCSKDTVALFEPLDLN